MIMKDFTSNKNVQDRADELQIAMPNRYSILVDRAAHFDEMLGKTIIRITGAEARSDAILFECSDGSVYLMYHEQDCCENVDIEDISGNVLCLIGKPLLKVEETSNSGGDDWGTHTYTYYHLATINGYVDIRWYGESNGYYSESVDFIRLRSGN